MPREIIRLNIMTNVILSLAAYLARHTPLSLQTAIYRSPKLARIIRRGLNRAAPTGRTEVTVAAGALLGMKLLLDLQSEKDYWLGTYEPDLQQAIANYVQPDMIVYDVGANIGYISLLFAKAVGTAGHVYAFEPLEDNVYRLRANVASNSMDMCISVIPKVVAGISGPVAFFPGPSGGTGKAEGSAGRQDLSYTEAVTLPGLSLDDFVYKLGHPLPHVVKMDIEGGEVVALPGMRRLLSEVRPLIFLELHGPEAAQAAWDELHRVGYRIYKMTPGYSEVLDQATLDWKAYLIAKV